MLRSKIIRIVCYFILFIVIPFLIIAISLNVYVNKRVIENIKERVSESTHNEYALSLDGLTINLLTRTISINDIIIAPSQRNIVHPKATYVFKAKGLKIVNFSILSYLKEHDLLIDRLEFEEPQISIFQGSGRLPKKNTEAENFSLYDIFSKTLNSISIMHIEIVNSQFNIYKNGIDTTSVFSTNDNSISIKNFNVNSETDKMNRLFVAEKFEIAMNKFSYHLGNGLYTLHGRGLHSSYIDSTLIVDSLQLVPNFSKKEFADEAGRQISRVKIISSKLICRKMDVKLFFEYNWLVIHKVNIEGCAIDVFRDNTLPLKHIVRPSLQAILKNLPFFVAVDTIEMKNGEAVYQQLNPGDVSSGKITLNKINGTITGVQNDTTAYTEESSIKASVSAYLLNQGKFSSTYRFPLKAREEFFYCSGSLSSMSMLYFNTMINPSKKITIKSGHIDSVSFSFVAHENFSNGTMKFMYHDLNVDLTSKDGENGLKEKVKTFLANKLVIRDSNPGKDGVVRISNIHAEHNPYRFFTYYSMQSILSGITPAIKDEKNARLLQKKK